MALLHSPSIARTGLVLHLDAANTKSYPGSGTAWTDLSGNGNNCTLINGPTFSSSNAGAIVFDGSNDYADCGISSSLTSFSSYTVSVIVSSSSNINNNYQPIYTRCINESTGQSDIEIYGGNGGIQLVHNRSNGGVFAGAVITALPATSLGFLDVTYNASSTSWVCYYNGVLRNTFTGISAPLATVTYKTVIGRFWARSSILANIYCLKVYNRALSATEITQNYNALRSRYGL